MKTLCTFLLALASTLALAQDKIYKKDKSVIDCIVTEIGLNEIKYYLSPEELRSSPIISISVDQVAKIVLSSGREIEFNDPLEDPNVYVDDKKRAIKVHFLSPLLEHLAFSYEKSLKPGRSIESEVGLIGIGFNTDEFEKSRGVFVSTGYKFMRTPDFYSSRMKYSHILKGGYVKPQVMLGFYRNETEDFFAFSSTARTVERDIFIGAFMINFGKQIIYDNAFLFDYSIGLGYGFAQESNFSEPSADPYEKVYHYGFLGGESSVPIALSFRLKIGLVY